MLRGQLVHVAGNTHQVHQIILAKQMHTHAMLEAEFSTVISEQYARLRALELAFQFTGEMPIRVYC